MTSKEILEALKALHPQRESVLDKQRENTAKREKLSDEFSGLLDEFARLMDQADQLHKQLESAFKVEGKRV